MPISCMIICPGPDPLPEDKEITDKDVLQNHTEAMENYARCQENMKCLIEWINE